MHIEHKAPDRHRRKAAIVDEIVPILVTQLGHVHPECGEQVLRVARRQSALGKRMAQAHGFGIVVALPQQIRLQPVELHELVFRLQARMIRDIVGNADELVECEDDAAMARVDQPRRHREVLVAVSLARTQLAGRAHCEGVPRSDSGAWI